MNFVKFPQALYEILCPQLTDAQTNSYMHAWTAGHPENTMLPGPLTGAGITSSSAMAQRLHELGDFKGVGHFEAKLQVDGLCFAPISMDH